MAGLRTGGSLNRRPPINSRRRIPFRPDRPKYLHASNYTQVTMAASDSASLSPAVAISLSASEALSFSEIGGRAQPQNASASITTLNTAVVTVLPPVANDERTTAVDLTAISQFSGQVDFDNTTATNNATDPTFIHAGYNSIFYKWTPTHNGTITFQTGPENLDGNTAPYIDTRIGAYTYSGSYTTIMENDDSPDDPNGLSSSITFTATASTTYYIIVASTQNTLFTDTFGSLSPYGIGPGYLAWNFSVTDTVIYDDQIVVSATTLPFTPTTISITVSEAVPGSTITATIGVTTIGADVVDDNGIAFITAAIPGLSPGAYTIVLTQSSPAATGTVGITVQSTSSTDTAPSGSTPPAHSATAWRFYDPVTTATYDFEINPDSLNAPAFERNLSSLVTTSIEGQPLVFEGNQRPISWSWAGWIKTQTQYDAFVAWYGKRYRVVLYDHLGRTIVLYIASFDPQPQIKNDSNPYLMRYNMTALVYSVT